MPQSDDIQKIIDEEGLDDMGYEPRWGSYRIRISKADITNRVEVLQRLMKKASESYNK